MKKILIPVTNHATLAGEKNGTYVPGLTHALHAFKEGGYDYDLVSVKGGVAPIYGEDTVKCWRKTASPPNPFYSSLLGVSRIYPRATCHLPTRRQGDITSTGDAHGLKRLKPLATCQAPMVD